MKHKLWFFIALGLLGLSIMLVTLMEDTVEVTNNADKSYTPSVSVVSVPVKAQSGILKTMAEIAPRWSVELKAHVTGEVIAVSDKAFAGELVNKDEVLIRLEDSTYKARLADAKKTLADANFQLSKEEKKSKQAVRNWELTGIKSAPTDLALRKPQLKAAQEAVHAAKMNILAEEKKRNYTVIKAPFSGIITKRLISMGQTISIGDPLLNIIHQEKLDIAASLSARQWKNLAQNWRELRASIKNDKGDMIAQANIKRGGGFLDPKTRQYKIFLEVDNDKGHNALAGEFVHIELPGKTIPNTMRIPEAAFTREGTVWYVDVDSRLRSFESEVLFYQNNELIVSAPSKRKAEMFNVITAPLASFIAGKEVAIKAAKEQ